MSDRELQIEDVRRRILGNGRVDPELRRRINNRTATIDEIDAADEQVSQHEQVIRELDGILADVATQQYVREAISKEDKHFESVTSTMKRRIKKIEERIDELEEPPEHIQERHEMNMKMIRRQSIGSLGIMLIMIAYVITQVFFI